MKSPYSLIVILLINSLYANAEVTLDGTLGRSSALPGPDYLIGADLGRQVGGNLFHSFRDFNLNSHESATFSGPNNVTNILSRVTGGNSSNIDGLIRSTIPNADMYFLNPHGIVFGPNARLDVQGSFHASTADYLHLKDGGRFEARQPSQSILTVAPVEAFGFLNSPVASISVQGHGEVTPDWEETTTGLTVPSGKTLSLIGGNIEIGMGTFFNAETFDDEGNESTEIIPLPILSAPHGRINLASMASQGEIFLGRDFVDASSLSQLADIHLTNNSLLRTNGEGGGSIFIHGGQFFADNSVIEAITLGSQDGGVIDLRANTISLNGATINGNTIGTGNGTNISLWATDFITVAGENDDFKPSAIYARSGHDELIDNQLGDAGLISLEAKNISFQDGGLISVSTFGSGKGGDITLKASESISFSGEEMGGDGSFVAVATYSDRSGAGDAGNLSIEAQKISFTEGSFIYSQTQGAGKGGNVTLKTSEIIEFSGEDSSGTASQINMITASTKKNAGDAGTLLIEADQMSFKKGAFIFNSTFGQGNAGTITLHANNRLELTGVSHEGAASRVEVSADEGTGNAGDIIVRAKDILLTDGAYLLSASFASGNAGNVRIHTTGTVKIAGANLQGWSSAIGSDSNPKTEDIIGGEGGNITIEANQLIVTDGGNISASSIAPKGSQSSRGGNVTIQVTGAVELSGVNPYGENEDGFGAGIYARSIGVEDNAGEGGKIVLQAGSLTIIDGAVIKSSTNNNAPGGDIDIQVSGTINITGDAAKIPLQAPADAQLAYLQDFSPTNYNQSTSGIYARSEGKHEQAGQSGNITLYAQSLILTNQGKISTSSAGGGQAGNIRIEVNQLQLDSSASIASESLMSNSYNEANLADRDKSILVLGEVIKVADVGDGTAGRYINTGKNLIRTNPVYSVADMDTLYGLPHQYSMAEGDVVEVRNAGDGNNARFIYAYNGSYGLEEWIRIDNSKATVSFDSMDEVNEIQNQWHSPEEATPYESGELISVTDAGDGKPATFLYAALLDPSDGWTQGRVVRINQFTVADRIELQGLNERTALQEGGVALVRNMGDGTSSHFIYQDNAWIKFGNVHTVGSTTEMNALTLAKTGNIAQIANTGNRFIYSGQSWLPLNNTYQVESLTERDNISVQTGDLVKVADAGNGKPESFFYVEGAWKKQVKGGDAGTITITTRDDTRLSNNSAITTQALSAGGGGITILSSNLLYLTDSQITTSVQEGAGNGGDLTIKNPRFVVLANGEIVAQAHEGRGGNIHITSDQFIASPDSLVSASSELGIDGEVKISSPDVDMSGALLVLPADFVDASGQLKPPCTATRVAQNSFVVKRFAGSPPSPYDWQSNRRVLLPASDEKTPSNQVKTLPSMTGKGTTVPKSSLKVASLTGCRPDFSYDVRAKTSATQRYRAVKKSSVIPEQLF